MGWKAASLTDLEVDAELPAGIVAYRRQQYRWARGSFECAFRLVLLLWASDLPRSSKIEGSLHLCGYFVNILLLALLLLFPFALYTTTEYPEMLSIFGIMALVNLAALAPAGLFFSSQELLGHRWYRSITTVVALTLVGVGMIINTARAALAALTRRSDLSPEPPNTELRDTAVDGVTLDIGHRSTRSCLSRSVLLLCVVGPSCGRWPWAAGASPSTP